MDHELRPVAGDEVPTFVRAVSAGFGNVPSDEEVDAWARLLEADRTLAAFDGPSIVGTAGAYSFELTLPGGTTAPAAGVTAVTVQPTHRRRGILRAMMARQLDDVAERGEPLAILTASESVIYGRFGYGLASYTAQYELATEGADLASPPPDGGRFRLVERDEAQKTLPGIYENARRRRPGFVTRTATWWELHLADPPWNRNGRSAFFHAVHESEVGEPDGYVTYRRKPRWDGGLPAGELWVNDMAAVDDEVEAVLWRFCLDVDLVAVVRAFDAPVDHPIRHRLADPRRLRTTRLHDFLWARIVDVPAALAARRYGTDDRLLVEVADAFRPQTSGTYAVEGGPAGAVCERAGGEADLALGIAELGAVYLGGERPSVLARAGRVVERTPGALRRADAFFASEPAPFCSTHF